MARFFTTRRSQWAPGLAVLVGAIGVTTFAGISVGARGWPFYIGGVLALLFALGFVERFRIERPKATRTPRRPRPNWRVIDGGRQGFDLEDDDSTENPKYLM